MQKSAGDCSAKSTATDMGVSVTQVEVITASFTTPEATLAGSQLFCVFTSELLTDITHACMGQSYTQKYITRYHNKRSGHMAARAIQYV